MQPVDQSDRLNAAEGQLMGRERIHSPGHNQTLTIDCFSVA